MQPAALPVVMLTSLSDVQRVKEAIQAGADSSAASAEPSALDELIGENGTGKEVAAHLIRRAAARAHLTTSTFRISSMPGITMRMK